MIDITIYTDGSCNNNRKKGRLPRVGGYACIIDTEGKLRQILRGGEMNSSSARMELAALQACLLYCNKEYHGERLRLNIFSDAEYIVNSINEGWIWRWVEEKWMFTKNSEIWKVITTQLYSDTIKELNITHVKGHAGNELNELADKCADEARNLMANLREERKINTYRMHDNGEVVRYIYNEL